MSTAGGGGRRAWRGGLWPPYSLLIFLLKGGESIRSEYLLNKEVEHVLALLTPSNQLVIQVCLHTGLRVSDVLCLKTAQIAPRFWITEQKTGKRKMIGLPEELRNAIKAQAGSEWCFEHRSDPTKHRTRQAVWKDVKRAATMLRIKQNATPHSFRKVFAVDMMKKYGDCEKVQKALNHSSPAVTAIYVMAEQLLQAKTLKKVYRAGKR